MKLGIINSDFSEKIFLSHYKSCPEKSNIDYFKNLLIQYGDHLFIKKLYKEAKKLFKEADETFKFKKCEAYEFA